MSVPGDDSKQRAGEAPPFFTAAPGSGADAPSGAAPSADRIRIRGVDLPLDRLVDARLRDPDWQAARRQELAAAKPFPHLVLEQLFHPELLRLVAQEFDDGEAPWAGNSNAYELTRRSLLSPRLGPATQLYFDLAHAGWFTACLSAITETPYLLTDPLLFGGGLHESRAGARFAVHRDFVRHPHVGLTNRMVMITYLNSGWRPEWGGDLELWDGGGNRCVTRVPPEFGHTLLLPHGPCSYHGHPAPLTPPPGVARRSVAAYYYTSPLANQPSEYDMESAYLRLRPVDRIKRTVRQFVPPLAWSLAKKLKPRAIDRTGR